MKRRSKAYKEALSLVDKQKMYSLEEAVKLVKETSRTKFDSTVEVAINLNVDPRKPDGQIRGAIVLPNGTGKTKRVLVLAKGPKATEAKNAGADYVGDVDMIEKIQKENWFDFETIIATPDMMPELGKIGKVLGPKGLMPNPKTGTVTMDVVKAIEEVKAGRVEYRVDALGIIHAGIGKVSFEEKSLSENIDTIVKTIIKLRPASVKGAFVKSISISSSMGPGIKLDPKAFIA